MDTPLTPNPKNDEYWANVKNLALTGFSVLIGDPEAIKTMVDLVANATYKGLEHLQLKDEEKESIKKQIEASVDKGADGVINLLTKFQKSSAESSRLVREKYGRKTN